MNERLTTNSESEGKIIEVQRFLGFQSKASIIRICVGISLKDETNPLEVYKHEVLSNDGMNYNRSTLIGEDYEILRLMFSEHLGYEISNNLFFPEMYKAHLIRGINKLYAFYELNKDIDKIFNYLGTMMEV